MAILPSARNTTYAPSSPILSNDLNAIQDCIVGSKHGTRPYKINASDWITESGGSISQGDGRLSVTAVSNLSAPVDCFTGQRIQNVRFDFIRPSGTIVFTLCKSIADVKTILATLTVNAGSTVIQNQSFAAAVNYVVEAGAYVYVRAAFGAAGTITGAEVSVDLL